MSERTRIDLAEFRARGYLQEVNRRFLHPLGLALEVVVEDDGGERLGGVWDCRDDPEGIVFVPGDLAEKAALVDAEWEARRVARESALGYMVQPASALGSLPAEENQQPRAFGGSQ